MIKNIKIHCFQNIIDPTDDNVDVEVLSADGGRYVATFFTIKNIRTLLESYKVSGECQQGLYFWSSDLIIVEYLSDENIRKVVDDLWRTEEFYASFSKVQ